MKNTGIEIRQGFFDKIIFFEDKLKIKGNAYSERETPCI